MAKVAERLWNGTRNLGDVTLSANTELDVHHCGACGVIFAIDHAFVDARRKDHASWCCPNGHWYSFTGPSAEEQLRADLERERNRRASVQARLDQEQARTRALKGVVTKTKKRLSATEQRAAAGVCPCCNRTFQQLSRHMQSKHPEFAPTPAA